MVWNDVAGHNDSLARKTQQVLVAVAPTSTAALTSILDDSTGDLAALPAEWIQLGRPTEDGVTWPRETELSEVFGLGSYDPVRSDIRRSIKRCSVTILETRKIVLELAQGVSDLAETVSATTTGDSTEITWDESAAPLFPPMRLLALGLDTTGDGEMYVGKMGPLIKVTEVGEEVWSNGDQSIATPLTFTLYNDPVLGTPLRHFRGGPGYSDALVTAEGFTPPA